MKIKITAYLFLLGLQFLCVASLRAETVAIKVLGGDGQPMPFVVISAEGAPETLRSTGVTNAIVDQIKRRFSPYITLVPTGGDVLFPNQDDTRHNVYSFSGKNSFELPLYRANDAPPVRFESPGIVKIGCNIHDSMKAYVVVTDNGSATVTDSDGLAMISSVALVAGANLSVWHPGLAAPITIVVPAANIGGDLVLSIVLKGKWQDPQAGKSIDNLESLLRRYSLDAD